MVNQGDITRMLVALRGGDNEVMNALFAAVYDELHGIAHRKLGYLRAGETLNTTALVHEAYLKLVDQSGVSWQDRAHFFAVSAKVMRHILVDYARRRLAKKRGGDVQTIVIDDSKLGTGERASEIVALDSALSQLSELNERLSKIVELRFFGGLSVEEAAEVLKVSPRTVKRDWRKARAFLYQALAEEGLV
jgi:RNA polymerase sigma factor (TIGR02999 family)